MPLKASDVPIDPEQMLSLSIITRRRNPLNLESLDGHILTAAEFDSTYAGVDEDFASLRSFAKAHGLRIDEGASSLARRTLVMAGRASSIEEAFDVKLLSRTVPGQPSKGHFPEGSVEAPSKYAHIIEAILGLDTRTIAQSHDSASNLCRATCK